MEGLEKGGMKSNLGVFVEDGYDTVSIELSKNNNTNTVWRWVGCKGN